MCVENEEPRRNNFWIDTNILRDNRQAEVGRRPAVHTKFNRLMWISGRAAISQMLRLEADCCNSRWLGIH